MQSWLNKNHSVRISNTWNGVQRGDPAVWDATGEQCMFVAHAVDEQSNTEWWTFALPDNGNLMHASSVYMEWTDGPSLHGVL